MKKRKKNKPISNQRNENQTDNLNYRIMSIRTENGLPATLDADSRSVEVVGATENPVEVFDFERFEIVNEILLMGGCEMPKSRQVPLLDSHRRYAGAVSVLGSYRDMNLKSDQLMGRVYFSSVPEAEGSWTKVREGHLTDFSIGYRPIDAEWVPAGETRKIKGRSFEGPVKVTTRWRVKELSVVPIGADELAKARQDTITQNLDKEKTTMNKKLRQTLEARGLSPEASEEEAWEFLDKLRLPDSDDKSGRTAKDKPPQEEQIDADQIRKEATGQERERIREIDAMCKRFDLTELADDFISRGATVDEARKEIMEQVAKKMENDVGYRQPAEITKDERDKFRAAAIDALLIRSGSEFVPDKPADGAQDFIGYSLRELARHALYVANKTLKGNPMQMVGRALTTSDLPYIMANVANKALFLGFETNEETWQVWCGTGPVSDFKTHYSPRISESDDLEEIPEHGEYQYGSRSEAQETYSIATYGKIFSVTRQAIINDDLGALTRIPQSHGEAAARKIGDVAYAVLTANAAMGDGVALFHANHNNLAASGAAPGTTTVAAGIKDMGTQKDLKGLRRLNIRPEYFIAPKALEGGSEVFFRSEFYTDEAVAGTPDEAFATTRKNPYSGDYFTRVYEPRLDDDSETAWYLAARRGRTIVVFFLNGEQRPYLETKEGWTVDGVEYKVRIDAGAKAMDFRGLYKDPGA